MSNSRFSTFIRIAPHVIGGVAVIVAAGYAGLWLGAKDLPTRTGEERSGRLPEATSTPETVDRGTSVTRGFYAYLGWDRLPISDVVLEEARLAEVIGVDALIVPVQLPWPGHGPLYADAFKPVRQILEAAPETTVILDLRMAPPATWFDENPTARVTASDESGEFPSLAHDRWRRDVASALRAAAEWLEVENLLPRIRGNLLSADANRSWGSALPFDRTVANSEAFTAWVASRGESDDRVRTAFESEGEGDQVKLPATFEDGEPFEVSPKTVFGEYSNDTVVNALKFLASETKSAFGKQKSVYLPYEYSHSGSVRNGTLSQLLEDRNVDGVVAPVSSTNRGVGGVGGFAGPVSSASYRGKEWIHLDDTRTGLERDAEQEAPAAAASEQVYHVQRRNFSAALVHGISYAAADPAGMGALLDTAMWERFGRMRDVQVEYVNNGATMGYGPPPTSASPLLVVTDDATLSSDSAISNGMLRQVRDNVLRSGVPAQFCLLEDVLEDKSLSAQAYLFLNAFKLSAPDRLRLRRKFQREKAMAIWMYAPGVIGPGSPEKNVSDTVGMRVRRFPSGATAGSKSELVSPWIEKDTPFGDSAELNPLFYIDDEDASTVARYRSKDQVSAAIKFFGEDEGPGWTSVYIAEPALPPGLLRELLQIAEVHVYVETTDPPVQQTMHLGRGLMAVHADQPGERLFDLGVQCAIEDVLNPARGWPRRRFLTLPMAGGETAIFRLIPETTSPASR
jgi:hypothetical protein